MKISVWKQFSSNHSSSYAIVGRFNSIEAAVDAETFLRSLMEVANTSTTFPERQAEMVKAYSIEWYKEGLEPSGSSDLLLERMGRDIVLSRGYPTWESADPIVALLHKLGSDRISSSFSEEELILRCKCRIPDAMSAERFLEYLRRVSKVNEDGDSDPESVPEGEIELLYREQIKNICYNGESVQFEIYLCTVEFNFPRLMPSFTHAVETIYGGHLDYHFRWNHQIRTDGADYYFLFDDEYRVEELRIELRGIDNQFHFKSIHPELGQQLGEFLQTVTCDQLAPALASLLSTTEVGGASLYILDSTRDYSIYAWETRDHDGLNERGSILSSFREWAEDGTVTVEHIITKNRAGRREVLTENWRFHSAPLSASTTLLAYFTTVLIDGNEVLQFEEPDVVTSFGRHAQPRQSYLQVAQLFVKLGSDAVRWFLALPAAEQVAFSNAYRSSDGPDDLREAIKSWPEIIGRK